MIRTSLTLSVILLCVARAGPSLADFVALEKSGNKASRPAGSPLAPQILDCSGAPALQINSTFSASTVGRPNNVDSYGCGQGSESGGEFVYALSVPELSMFEIRLTADCDLDLALLDDCDAITGCLIVADTGIRTTSPVMGDFFLVVDGFEGAACDFTVEIVATDPWSVNPVACQTATALSCPSSSTFAGDTCAGDDHLRALGCEQWPAAGVEDWYRLTVVPGGSFQVDLTIADADAVLWILGGCGEAPACLDYSDAGISGEAESVTYTNAGAENHTVYLVVDSYGPASCGAYDAALDCNGVIVATQVSSWSALKADFNREEK